MKYPKVLVAVTIYSGKEYIWDKSYRNLLNLDYPNYDIVIVDNTKGTKYYNKLVQRTKKEDNVRIYQVERGANSRIAHANSLNKLREVFLDENYDYFMSIEFDLLPPIDIIQRLMSHNKPVVGCLYQIGFAGSKSQPPRPCLFEVIRNKEGKTTKTANLPPSEGYALFGNGVIPIHGCGLGTTLIEKSILQRFPFWYYTEDNVIRHSDVLFYLDLHNAKIEAFVDTDIFIPHYNQDWKLVKDA